MIRTFFIFNFWMDSEDFFFNFQNSEFGKYEKKEIKLLWPNQAKFLPQFWPSWSENHTLKCNTYLYVYLREVTPQDSPTIFWRQIDLFHADTDKLRRMFYVGEFGESETIKWNRSQWVFCNLFKSMYTCMSYKILFFSKLWNLNRESSIKTKTLKLHLNHI